MAKPVAPGIAPDLRTMATVLACLGDGLADDVACIEALQWAKYRDRDIVAYLGLARQFAYYLRATEQPRPRKPA
jgi:hypothetical protein